ncbi:hypothetical protein [Methanobacterium sp.]|uniref:hypothetical protein n=1 Tax=Methanobacterium sp. TaxID=2164 RepID=UPI0025D2A659|nr:hypothetical protein [Methanobacterium sp.]MBI5460509.1 hypothetical protein [Methanobacterium sp.]
MVDTVDTTGSHHFPQRKNKFKKMVGRIWSRGRSSSNKKPQKMPLLRYTKENEGNWLSEDPKRWNKFQEEYRDEFEDKIKLMDEIRDKKKGNEALYWFFTAEDPDF